MYETVVALAGRARGERNAWRMQRKDEGAHQQVRQFTCFTSARVQIPTYQQIRDGGDHLALPTKKKNAEIPHLNTQSVYLLY
jgi:hypothetical protein